MSSLENRYVPSLFSGVGERELPQGKFLREFCDCLSPSPLGGRGRGEGEEQRTKHGHCAHVTLSPWWDMSARTHRVRRNPPGLQGNGGSSACDGRQETEERLLCHRNIGRCIRSSKNPSPPPSLLPSMRGRSKTGRALSSPVSLSPWWERAG